jgi:hypothetical protein
LSRKRYCLVPPSWDLHDFQLHTCSDRSHCHISRAQLYDLEKYRSIRWVAIRYNKGEELVPIENPDVNKKWDSGIVRISMVFGFRGMSSSVGEYLADALRRRESWAVAMLAQIIEDELTKPAAKWKTGWRSLNRLREEPHRLNSANSESQNQDGPCCFRISALASVMLVRIAARTASERSLMK